MARDVRVAPAMATLHVYAPGDRLIVADTLLEIRRVARTRWGSPTYRGETLDGSQHRWITPRTIGRPANVIDRDAIRTMVDAFYARVADDALLAPIFARHNHGVWEPHLTKMVSFWASVLLREGSFVGSPPAVHRAIGELSPAHFARWVSLFESTLDAVFEPGPREHVRVRARGIARGLSTTTLGAPWDEPRAPQPG